MKCYKTFSVYLKYIWDSKQGEQENVWLDVNLNKKP